MSVSEDPPEESGEYHTIDEPLADKLRSAHPDRASIQSTTKTTKGLGNSTRLEILAYLKEQDLCVHDLSALLDMSQSAVSHQLKQLRDCDLLNRRKEGRVVYYSLNKSGIENFFSDLRTIILD